MKIFCSRKEYVISYENKENQMHSNEMFFMCNRFVTMMCNCYQYRSCRKIFEGLKDFQGALYQKSPNHRTPLVVMDNDARI